MTFNLPPGGSLNDIPGNRPEDLRYERWLESFSYEDVADAMTDHLLMDVNTESRYTAHERIKLTLLRWLEKSCDDQTLGDLAVAFDIVAPFEDGE